MAELYRYAAFISYSSKDAKFAQRLHRALESYGIPSSLGKFDLIGGGGKKNRIYPVFRDREELSAGHLGDQIEANLKASAALIVVCSPNGAASPWVQKEIEFFAAQGRHAKIFAIIPDTAPLTDEHGADCTQACFPQAFRGDALSGDKLEPLAADARKGKDGFRNAWLKIVAGMVGVSPGQIIDRDKRRRAQRSIAVIAAIAMLLLAGGAGLVRITEATREANANRANTFAAEVDRLMAEGRHVEALRIAIAGDPAARRSWLDHFLAPEGYHNVRSALAAAYVHQRDVRFVGHVDDVDAVAVSADGTHILTAGADLTIRLWDPNGVELRQLETTSGRIATLAFSPDGELFIAAGDNGAVRVWETESGREVRRLDGHEGTVRAVAFSSDGLRVLTGGDDGTVRLWDIPDGREVRRFEPEAGAVRVVSFSPDGARAIAGGPDCTARFWDIEGGRELHRWEGHGDAVRSLAFSPDGERVVAGCGSVAILWDARSWSELRRFEAGEEGVLSVGFSQDAAKVVTAGDGGMMRVWDVASGREALRLEGHEEFTLAVALLPDGRVVTTGREGSVRLRDPRRSRELRRFDSFRPDWDGEITSVAFSSDSAHVLASDMGGAALIWDARTGREVHRLEGHEGQVWSVAFSPDASRVLTGGQDGTVRLWDALGGRELKRFEGARGRVFAVAFSPDGSRVLSGGDDGALLWDVASGDEVVRFDVRNVHSAAFSPDGEHVLTGSDEGAVELWDFEGRKLRTFEGHQGDVLSAVFLSGGTRLLTGGEDGTARLWDVATGRELRRFGDQEGRVLSVAFSRECSCVLTGGEDGAARLWDIATSRELRTFERRRGWVFATFSPDGKQVLTGDPDPAARLWEVDRIISAGSDEQVRLACEALIRLGANNFTAAERQRLTGLSSTPCPVERNQAPRASA